MPKPKLQRPAVTRPVKPATRDLSADLAEQTAAFLARGGKIKQLPAAGDGKHGAVAQNVADVELTGQDDE